MRRARIYHAIGPAQAVPGSRWHARRRRGLYQSAARRDASQIALQSPRAAFAWSSAKISVPFQKACPIHSPTLIFCPTAALWFQQERGQFKPSLAGNSVRRPCLHT